MTYILAFLIEGEAKHWHMQMTSELLEKFGIWDINQRIAPHVTLFRPFEMDDITPIKTLIADYVHSHPVTGNFTMNDFEKFDESVVYAKSVPDAPVQDFVLHFRDAIKQVPGMREDEHKVWRPHATLARLVTAEQIKAIWDYIATVPKPNFILPFDNIAILRLVDNGWVTDEVFPMV